MNHWLNEGKEILGENQIDDINNIERQPILGCVVLVIGTILFWSMVYWFYNLITS